MDSHKQRKPAGERRERSFYTLSEAAEVLGVHYETAARWVRSGKLPGVKLSRRKVIVPKETCDALLSGSLAVRKVAPSVDGPPRWWLPLVGTLTPKEADQLLALVQDCCERIENED